MLSIDQGPAAADEAQCYVHYYDSSEESNSISAWFNYWILFVLESVVGVVDVVDVVG